MNPNITSTVFHQKLVVEDLGVILDQKFTFVYLISAVTSKSCKLYGNSKDLTNVSTLITLFFLIRTHLKYRIIIWFPLCEVPVQKH